MIYEVTNRQGAVDFAPADETAEILQNVRTILSTVKGSAPLYREFGLTADNLDKPINIATAQLAAELATEIAEYEPRCKFKKLDAAANFDGTLKLVATVEV